MKELFGFLGAACLAASLVPYVAALWHGRARPHAFSWFLWGLINAIIFAAQASSGGGPGAWTAGVTALANLSIGFYAVFHGEKNYTRGDWAVFLAALASLPLWVVTRDPLWSVLLVSAIDIFAFFPTIRKSWLRPHEEVASTFVIGGIGFFFSLLALETYSFVNWCYPVVVLAVNTAFLAMLFSRRRALA